MGPSRLRTIILLFLFLDSPLCAQELSKSAAAPPAPPGIYNTEKAEGAPTPATVAAQKMTVPDGFHVSVFAAEPDVQQPLAMTTDERGRLWVVENYTYAERKRNYDMNLHDRIVIFEDTDNDGHFDRRKVFWDQGGKLTSLAVGFGGVWVLCAPNLLFLPDRNRDDVPDGEPEVLLDGWNSDSIRHNIVNGLMWGPDGWLYGRHGIKATSSVGKPGDSPSQRVKLNCSIWRYHPTRHLFEVVARGTTNSWGCDYDDYGQMFFINTVIGHLWHVVPGVHLKRMYGTDFNPHLYGLIDQCADHYHWDTGEAWSDVKKGMSNTTSRAGGGHAHCGLTIYLGDNWPERYRNTLFTVNLHGLRINNDRVERRGAGYVGKHCADFLFANDPWFRGVDLKYGPDGAVFIADWTDIGECHENDGVHRTSGRIYKVTYGPPRKLPPFDLSRLSSKQLVQLQLRHNDWYVRQARRLLQERAVAGADLTEAKNALFQMYAQQSDVTRKLRALWCLNVIGALNDDWLLNQLNDRSEHIRVWAIRLLVDKPEIAGSVPDRFARLAKQDPSGLVRLFLASAMQRLSLPDRWAIARSLLSHAGDAKDPALPLMIWYGIEPAIPSDSEQALDLVNHCRIPQVRRFIARRITGNLEREPVAVDALVERLLDIKDLAFQQDVLQGMTDALRGWSQAPAPADWPRVKKLLSKSSDPAIRQLVRDLSVVFGDGRAIDELRGIATDAKADAEARRHALHALVQNHSDDLVPLLQKLVNDRVVSTEAIRGLAAYNDAATPRVILKGLRQLAPDGRAAVIDTLAARPSFAHVLLDAVEQGRIEPREISAFHARQIRSFGDAEINKQLSRVWGDVRESSADKRARINELTAALTPERLQNANLSNGRLVFKDVCAKCHTLYGQGGQIGPDLTGSNRKVVSYLLENIVDPSATMINDFKVSVVVLDDGRVITGVVMRKTDRTVSVQTDKELLVLDRKHIDNIVPQNISLMPEGLLKPLTDDQLRDLIGYLSGDTQVPLPDVAEESAGEP